MDQERYPGERRGLALFLEELLPLVERELGPASLLHHCIRRALRGTPLRRLRHARQMFSNLPRETKRRLSIGLIAAPDAAPGRDELLETYSQREPAPFVCFEPGDDRHAPGRASVGIRHELLEPNPVQVMVRPGTLPSSVAHSLREIAALIERDRRLLSPRYWRRAERTPKPEREGAERR
jgi:hypothetical protein